MKKLVFILIMGLSLVACKSNKEAVKEYDLSKVSELDQRAAQHLRLEDEVKYDFFDILVDAKESIAELNMLHLTGSEKTMALKDIRNTRVDRLIALLGEDGYNNYKRFIASQSPRTKPVGRTPNVLKR